MHSKPFIFNHQLFPNFLKMLENNVWHTLLKNLNLNKHVIYLHNQQSLNTPMKKLHISATKILCSFMAKAKCYRKTDNLCEFKGVYCRWDCKYQQQRIYVASRGGKSRTVQRSCQGVIRNSTGKVKGLITEGLVSQADNV